MVISMKKILFSILLLLFSFSYSNAGILAGGLADNSSAAAGFSWSTAKIAEYRFEDGALGTDSSGIGNNLTPAAGFTVNTTYYKQGSASADVNQSTTGVAYLADGSLSAGFPGKSSGGNSNFLVMGWARPREVTTGGSLVAKYYATDTYRSWEIFTSSAKCFKVYASDDGLSASINYAFTAANGGLELSINTWYHFAFWIDETIGQYGIIIYEAVAGEKKYSADLPAAFESELYDGGAYLGVGARYSGSVASTSFDGKIDQVVVYTWTTGNGPSEAEIENQVSAVRGGTAP
jgi:hypothetical protein